MDLTEDSFRALARSSPWLFRQAHLRVHTGPGEGCEVWLDRPDGATVQGPSGERHRLERHTLSTRSTVGGGLEDLGEVAHYVDDPDVWEKVRPTLNCERPLERRPDGLVAHRPEDWDAHRSDPMWQTYLWVAMLDPFELSFATEVEHLRADVHRGRPVWRARMRPADDYDPCCGCCPILLSEVSERHEYDDCGEHYEPRPEGYYPDAYEVALDVATGVLVSLDPVGGQRPDYVIDLEILEAR